jgi:hypothetical protein
MYNSDNDLHLPTSFVYETRNDGTFLKHSCGNVKIQVAESGKWNCDRCRSETPGIGRETQMPKFKLKSYNGETRRWKQLPGMENGKNVGKGDKVTVKPVGEKCLVLGDSIVRNGAGKSDEHQMLPGN